MIVRSHQNYSTNSYNGFAAQLLKNATAVTTDGIGGVTDPIVEDRPVISSWPDWEPLKKHGSISTVEWLRDKWGADGTFDLPHPDRETFDKSEIERWARSNDALVRTVGRICFLFFDSNDFTGLKHDGSLASPESTFSAVRSDIHKSRMQEPSDSKFWKDYVAQSPYVNPHKVNRPGEEINEINWNDAYERAQEVNSRFDWLKKNWAENDKKKLLENKQISVPKKYWKMMSDLFPTETKDENGYMNLTKDKINALLYDLKYIHKNLYDGFDPGMEAYARYLNWLHDSIGWNNWSINVGI